MPISGISFVGDDMGCRAPGQRRRAISGIGGNHELPTGHSRATSLEQPGETHLTPKTQDHGVDPPSHGGAIAEPRLAAIARLVRDLPGGSFAFVMATGIVSIAADFLGLGGLAVILFAINLLAFSALSAAMLIRLAQRPSSFLSELRDDRRGPGLLTVVAGTSVLGDQIRLLTPHQSVAAALWLGAFAIWVCLIYCLFAALTLRPAKTPLGGGFDGNWLLAVVATQSLTVLGTGVKSTFPAPEIVVFASLCLFLVGGVFYFVIITSFCIAGCSRRCDHNSSHPVIGSTWERPPSPPSRQYSWCRRSAPIPD
jgi:hypothetical protein